MTGWRDTISDDLADFREYFAHHQNLLEQIVAAQDDINAAVTAIGTAVSTLDADVTALTAALAAGGTPVDTSALNAAVPQLVDAVNAVTALVPATPTS
jgi:ABC-type transporter Mla subunit MlaD